MLSDGFTFTHGQPLQISPNFQSSLHMPHTNLSSTPSTSLTTPMSATWLENDGKGLLGEMMVNESLAMGVWSQDYYTNFVSCPRTEKKPDKQR